MSNPLRHICFIPDGNRRQGLRDHLQLSEAYRYGADRAIEEGAASYEDASHHLRMFSLAIVRGNKSPAHCILADEA